MIFKGEVQKQEGKGDEVLVTLTNVRQSRAARWREYSPGITIAVPFSQASRYQVGRSVRITVEPR